MKYFYFFLISSLLSCSSGEIYDGSLGWKFTVKNSSIDRTDTLSLHKSDSWYPKLIWSFNSFDNGIKADFTSEKRFTNNSSVVKLPSLFGLYLEQTELVPHPEVRFPVIIGDSYKSNYKTDSQDNSIDNIGVEGTLEVVGKITYLPKLLKDSSWVINAVGSSSEGKFSSTYYFNEKYGFVYFKYFFGKDTIEIKLHQLSTIEILDYPPTK